LKNKAEMTLIETLRLEVDSKHEKGVDSAVDCP
jgi:hypothetical protein